MRRASRGRAAVEVDGTGVWVGGGWEAVVVCVLGMVWEVFADEAGTPFVCGWLVAILAHGAMNSRRLDLYSWLRSFRRLRFHEY